MGAVGIYPLAVDNSLQYRPHESPANSHIVDDAGDAVGTLRIDASSQADPSLVCSARAS